MRRDPCPPMNIIDNRTKKLVDEVNKLLTAAEFSKMAVGYFYLSGFEAIRPNLANVQRLKLLIGNSSNQQTADELVAGYARLDLAARDAEQLNLLSRDQVREVVDEALAAARQQLEHLPQDDRTESGVKTLAQLIAENRIEVRVYTRGTLHAKAYVFAYAPARQMGGTYKGSAIVGSSNLSYSGMSVNTELNVMLKENEDFEQVEKWFDELWKDAEPFDAALMNVVRASWVARQMTPYELYLKTLYELVKDRLAEDGIGSVLDEMNLPPLMDFQVSAFRRACSILERHHGVFIADVVGFGKSYIGSAVVKYLRDRKRERTLIVCPARLVPMWERYNDEFDLGARVLSMGMLKYPADVRRDATIPWSLNDEEEYETYQNILIDESHNFRNPNTDRYEILQPYLRGRKVILLTATPQNKSVWDYYYQIKLFHPQENTAFPIPTARLDQFFRDCEQRPQAVSQLLDHVLIRRRRRDIIDVYQPVLNGVPVTFPTRKLKTWDYNIEDTYQSGLYDEITRIIRSEMKFTRYGLANYLRPNLPKEKRKKYDDLSRTGSQLRGLIKMLLLKRMESSAQAFVNTINTMGKGYRVFRAALDSGVVLVGDRMKEIVRQMLGDSKTSDDFRDAIDDETLMNLYELLADEYKYDMADFDEKTLSADTNTDIAALAKLAALVRPVITRNVDDKRDELVRQLGKLDGQKVLIFTEFQDTAEYLDKALRAAFPGRTIACATGSTNTIDLVRRFAPHANLRRNLRPGEPEIDLLIATDALSEGQNLQDASIVINYDIHWNPVRLIQRIGRVDRIGSEASEIRVFNFLPERSLEAHLNLQSRVQRRVQEIHDVLGEDDKILTDNETLNERAMYAMAHGDADVLESDPHEALTPLQEAERVIRDLERNDAALFARIKDLPGGLRGPLPETTAPGTTFALFRSADYRKLYLQTADGPVVDEGAILKVLRCAPETAGAPMSAGHNASLMRLFGDFENELDVIESNLDHQRTRTRAQQYVDDWLQVRFNQITDPKERKIVEDLREYFTGDIERYVLAAISRVARERLTGGALVNALTALYLRLDLGADVANRPRRRFRDAQRLIVCSGSAA